MKRMNYWFEIIQSPHCHITALCWRECITVTSNRFCRKTHDIVIKWKHIPRYWPFVRGIHRSPVTRSFDIVFDLRRNKRLSKQSRRWWFETLPRSSWGHCNEREQRMGCDYSFIHYFNGSLAYQPLMWGHGWLIMIGLQRLAVAYYTKIWFLSIVICDSLATIVFFLR